MGGMVPYSGEPVDAGLGPGVTITGAQQPQGGRQRRQPDQIMGLTGDQWIALSAMLNALVLAGTLLLMIYEM